MLPDGQSPLLAVLPDRVSLMRRAAERIVLLAEEAIRVRGRFTWALGGGSTPKDLYSVLASAEYVERVDWTRVEFFWGDERCVSPVHPASNYRMARETLLEVVRPEAEQVHRMEGELEPSEAASRYQRVLERSFTAPNNVSTGGFPRFDLILLGMGADGHTASLFPGSRALDETERWVVESPVLHGSPAVDRLTLTLPVLNAARCVLFLISGADKAERLAEVHSGKHAGPPYPAELVRPELGAEWLVDGPAGSAIGASL